MRLGDWLGRQELDHETTWLAMWACIIVMGKEESLESFKASNLGWLSCYLHGGWVEGNDRCIKQRECWCSMTFFKMSLFYLFIFGCTGSECGAQAFASPCGGFSCCWAPALGRTHFSSFGAWAVKPRLSSCGARAYLLHGIWDLPGPGIKPVSPALGFLTTESPRKPCPLTF